LRFFIERNDIVLACLTGWGHDFSWVEESPTASEIRLIGSREELSQLLAEKAGGKLVLCGWSLGGIYSLQSAVEAKKVDGLICLATTACFSGESSELHASNKAALTAMRRRLERDKEGVGQDFFHLIHTEPKSSLFESFIKMELGKLKQGLKDLASINLESDLSKIEAPVLVVHGEKDPLIPFAAAESLSKSLSSAELLKLSEAGHDFVFQRDRALEQRVGEFISRL